MQKSTAFTLLIVTLIAACERQPSPSALETAASASVEVFGNFEIPVGNITQVRAVTMDLPLTPRPYDTDPEALIPALQETDGRATLAFKEPSRGVTLSGAGGGRAIKAAVSPGTIRRGIAMLADRGVVIRSYFRSIGVVAVTIPPEIAPGIASHPLVDWVEPVQSYQFDSDGRSPVRAPSRFAQTTPWGIDSIRAPDAWEKTAGNGAKIMFIDTGHERGHEDLPLLPTGNCGGVGPGGCDDLGTYHGTGVMGVAVARDNTLGTVGVAPGIAAADVYMWSHTDGGEFMSDSIPPAIEDGQEWGVDVISMSFGNWEYNASIASAISYAKTYHDIFFVASAGNHYLNSPPPVDTNTYQYPAMLTDVMGVAGVNEDLSQVHPTTNHECPSGWASNHGPQVLISAPNDFYTTQEYDDGYDVKCGTSYAAPAVAAVAAMVRARLPDISPLHLMWRLTETARDLGAAGSDTIFGEGLVDAYAALGPWPSISGPEGVQPEDENCEWTSQVSGGYPGTLYYSWYAEDSLIGTGTSVSYSSEMESFDLILLVEDGQSMTGADTLEIIVDSEADECEIYHKASGRGG